MKNLRRSAAMLAVLALVSSANALRGQSGERQTNSVSGLPSSATRAIDACAAAADELAASRRLIGLLERENTLLTERLSTEKRISQMLTEMNESRRAENEVLRMAFAAQKETIAAKDALIADQKKLHAALKKSASSPWKRLGDVLIGVAAGIVLR